MNNLAPLTGRGSFTFTLGGQRFRGVAVPLADYFAWTALQGNIGSPEHVAWYVPLLAERQMGGAKASPIDAEWVSQNVRLAHLNALDSALLEEVDPGEAFGDERRQFPLHGGKFAALSYSLGEAAAHNEFLTHHEGKPPMNERLERVALALRLRARGGIDPADIDLDWMVKHVKLPELLALEHLFQTGRLGSDPAPVPKAEGDGEKKE
ncbi:hypothetical protein WDJ50_18690 (plasmid) [Deinococcus sp. VB142]|uniref:Uncharacterized protein n=1 Tax=Deinococcus sp. VB142 TaxID=3112952 RepID=A0AAU6Q8N3_9DEIO